MGTTIGQDLSAKFNFDYIDETLMALTIWREAKGEGYNGMLAVGCVIKNNAIAKKISIYEECTALNQYSSITVHSDPETISWPKIYDPSWKDAKYIAADILTGDVPDITKGAHFYENPKVASSGWFKNNIVNDPIKHPKTITLGNHVFYK